MLQRRTYGSYWITQKCGQNSVRGIMEKASVSVKSRKRSRQNRQKEENASIWRWVCLGIRCRLVSRGMGRSRVDKLNRLLTATGSDLYLTSLEARMKQQNRDRLSGVSLIEHIKPEQLRIENRSIKYSYMPHTEQIILISYVKRHFSFWLIASCMFLFIKKTIDL